MKTLVFCTAYAPQRGTWDARYWPWLRAVLDSRFNPAQILLVDDASPGLPPADAPAWKRLRVVHEPDAVGYHPLPTGPDIALYHFNKRLGRHDLQNFPGWYRSFAFAVAHAAAQDFERVIHIESDAYLISARVQAYFNQQRNGWTTLWSQKYNSPEIVFQVVHGAALRTMRDFFALPYDRLIGRSHEHDLPYTHIEKGFAGDRFGEDGKIPWDADYAAQTQPWLELDGGWWTGSPRRAAAACMRPLVGRLRMDFGDPSTTRHFLGQGWSPPDETQSWMRGEASEVTLPPMPTPIAHRLRLHMVPNAEPGQKPNRVTLALNGAVLGEASVGTAGAYLCELPRAAILAEQPNRLVLHHPGGMPDAGIAVRHLGVSPARSPLPQT